MKYLIAFAGITTVVSAIGVVSVDPKCARDNCLRNVIASDKITRSGYADCTSFLKTTITPAPVTVPAYYTTIPVVTEAAVLVTIDADYTPGAVSPNKRRDVDGYRNNGSGFRKIKRDDPEPVPGTAITVTNMMPDYMIKSCTSERGKLATDRYSSACSCVGAIAGPPTSEAIPTISTPEAVPHPDSTSYVTPEIVKTAYNLKVQITSATGTLNGKYITTSGTLLVPTASPAASAATLRIEPNGKTTLNGKLVIARISSLPGAENTRYLAVGTDGVTIPPGAAAVSCQIAADSTITCTTALDFDRWILHIGSSNSLRLLKQGASSPDASYNFNNFVVKAVPPA
ncbi:hypothetical protein TWF281_008998 [Arthrobotrys megalospora]